MEAYHTKGKNANYRHRSPMRVLMLLSFVW